MSQQFLELIRLQVRKRVPLDELKRLFQEAHPEAVSSPSRNRDLLLKLQELEALGVVQLPAKGSWEKFGSPPLPSWVQRIVVKTEPGFDYSTVAWVPELGFWPTLKSVQMEPARLINEFLLRRRGALGLVPLKERSLEIFGNEKKLDEMRRDDALFNGLLPLAAIGAFQVPLPLPYRAAEAPGQPVLVVENHDSFWSLGEWNATAKRYAAVVYGSGLAFQSSGRALRQVLKETQGIGAEYLGDLDPAGISIPVSFNASQGPTGVQVRPAIHFYAWLLRHGVRRTLEQGYESAVLRAGAWMDVDIAEGLAELWSEGSWIPQEALGIEKLRQDFPSR